MWRPIETAPKDGTVVVIRFGQATPDAAFWDGSDPKWPWITLDPRATTKLNGYRANFPTHWKPLDESTMDTTNNE